ncbi:hypothetical protein F0562_020989 [Nyssa sinensis]|uniref:Uncharacterized protein n=1 Tax=Nyssa sinensis TaxID=561372 RepID=A0A5J5BLI3_9ASTE|nr:hypothetical protein F0562_020989 [Nyssa sinensis]
MSELCLSSKTKSTQFSSLLLSDFFLFCSFILSHPLYFSYFIFFSPYLLKLLSFLSPLFITTTLLLLALLTVSPSLIHDNSPPELSEPKVSFLLSTYHAVKERLQSKTGDESEDFHRFEGIEAYGIVFDTSIFDVRESPVEVLGLRSEENSFQALEAPVLNCLNEEKAVEIIQQEPTQLVLEGKSLEGLFKELDDFENIAYNVEEKKVEPPGTKSNKVEGHKEESSVRSGSEAVCNKISNITVLMEPVHLKISSDRTDNGGGVEYTSDFMESSRRLGDSNLGSYGSMRKEKEWNRTLACKLFEERRNVDGGEGMDLLWETYEVDSSKAKPKGNTKKKSKKKSEIDYYEDDDDEDLEEEMDGQLCCLQALKFSAGKMNLGMGRPNLVKISKAIKGLGWLHHVSRHGKKGNGFLLPLRLATIMAFFLAATNSFFALSLAFAGAAAAATLPVSFYTIDKVVMVLGWHKLVKANKILFFQLVI